MLEIFNISTIELDSDWIVSKYATNKHLEAHVDQNKYKFIKLGEICEVISGKYVKSYEEKGTPYIRVNNIRGIIGTILNEDLVYVSDENKYNVLKNCICQEGDILIARTGTLGKAVLVTEKMIGYTISQHVTILRLNDNKEILPGILCLYLNSDMGKRQLIGNGAGSTRLELTHESMKSILIPKIDKDVQINLNKRITDLLNEYYKIIDNINSLTIEVDKLLFGNNDDVGMINDNVFSINNKSLEHNWSPSNNKPSMRLNIDNIKNRFKHVKLGDISEIKRGKGTRSSEYKNCGIPYIRTSSLINHSIDPFPDHYASSETFNKFNQPIQDGDILYSIEGKVGQVALLNSNLQVVFKNHIQIFRVKNLYEEFTKEEMSGWIYILLGSKLGKIMADKYTVVQSTIPGLGSSTKEFIIPLDYKFKAIGKKAYDNLNKLIEIIVTLHEIQEKFEELLDNSYK